MATAGSWAGRGGCEQEWLGPGGRAGAWDTPEEHPAPRQPWLQGAPSTGWKVWLARPEGFVEVGSNGNRERPR